MTTSIPKITRKGKSTFRLFRHFYLISVVAIIVILVVAGLGLRSIFRKMVLEEAQRDAIRISYALRDCEVKEFISIDDSKEQSLFIPAEEMASLDHEMRIFLAPFDIVKIKIFNTETRIIYSTDPKIIGKLNMDNDKLAGALNGTAVSKYETKDHVWDLEGEKNYDVGIVETYVPIYSDAGKVIGSFEIYKEVTEDFQAADKVLLHAGTIFFIIVVGIFSVLMFIIHHSAETIKTNAETLAASNESLKKEIIDRKQAEQERQHLETQLWQSQKMQAVGTLAGGIAHDFNNILGSIIGYTNLALDDVPDGTIANGNLKQVLIAGSRAKDLVRQILTFSRQDEHQKKPVEIASVVRETLLLLRSSLPATLEIKQNIEADSSMIMADSTQIHQVIMNLCTNAADAMADKKGVLEVSLTDIDLKSDTMYSHSKLQAGQYVKLAVKDTGHGIDSVTLERIFEPFFTTKAVGKGTGMGLAVIHGIVENHSGIITVDSKVGEGTTFNIFFPGIESSDVSEDNPSEIVAGQGEVILVVDDEKPLVDVTKQMLERAGYTVEGFTSSVDAAKAFRAEPDKFDLVITDYAMPVMSGKELTKELLQIRSDIPIILCTGFSEEINAEEANNMGVKNFVMKPVAREEITRIIRNLLDRKEIVV